MHVQQIGAVNTNAVQQVFSDKYNHGEPLPFNAVDEDFAPDI